MGIRLSVSSPHNKKILISKNPDGEKNGPETVKESKCATAMRSSSSHGDAYALLCRSFQRALAQGASRTSCRDETAPTKAKLE